MAVAAVPQTINYQGYLTDADGAMDGPIDIIFSIYDVEADGTALWTEMQTVMVYNGVYSVLLGTVDTIGNPLDLTFDEQYWLGVTVDTDSEMTPRQPLTSVPYALNAQSADTAAAVSDDVVTASKIASGAVTSGKIAAGAVGSTEIIDGSITAADLEAGASDDADADATNELNTGVALVGTELQVTDAGGTLSADLSSLENVSPWTTVMKWETVGTPGFSAGSPYYTSLALDPAGTPDVAYQDEAQKATVMRYNGSAWETVGTAGFSVERAFGMSLALDSAGMPYVAYRGETVEATVMRYNGSAWENVGTPGFSAGWMMNPSLALDSADTPYVAYSDGTNSQKVTVMRYSGGVWETVGTAGFSAGTADYTSLAIDSAGTPYLAISSEDEFPASVMRYNGSAWEIVGAPVTEYEIENI